MARSLTSLLDDQWPTRQTSIGPDRLSGRENRSVGKLIPNSESEAEVDVLAPFESVVNPVIVGAGEDPFQRSESKVGVRVLEGQDTAVDN